MQSYRSSVVRLSHRDLEGALAFVHAASSAHGTEPFPQPASPRSHDSSPARRPPTSSGTSSRMSSRTWQSRIPSSRSRRTAQDAFPDRFLKITQGVCFGDSGGPLFHDGTLVALNTWTFSYRCDGPNLEYRVDSAPAQAFLKANL